MSKQGKFTEYKCKCGKDYFGEYKKTNMLIRMHHKICTETYMPVSGTVKLDFDVVNPKSHLGEKNKQQRIAEIVSVIKTNRVLGNPPSNVSPPIILS